MIPFDPADPFPLLPEGSYDYPEARSHSEFVDLWLNFRISDVEQNILENSKRYHLMNTTDNPQQLWVGLPVQTLLTPYVEIRGLLQELEPQPNDRFVDLGAGYGRMGLVLGRHYPTCEFVGYEYVPERVKEGQRILRERQCLKAQLIEADLSSPSFVPQAANFYFMYDFGTRQAIQKTLADLRDLSATRAITVIGRGRASRDAIERDHAWLSQVIPPEHRGNYSIYRSGIRA